MSFETQTMIVSLIALTAMWFLMLLNVEAATESDKVKVRTLLLSVAALILYSFTGNFAHHAALSVGGPMMAVSLIVQVLLHVVMAISVLIYGLEYCSLFTQQPEEHD